MKKRKSNVLRRTGKGYLNGKVCTRTKCLPVTVTCRGKIAFTKAGRRSWFALKRASAAKAKAKARSKAHRVTSVHHRKPVKRRTVKSKARKKPCGCGA